MGNGSSGSKIGDHDEPTSMVLGVAAAINTGGGIALVAMSSTFHVVMGSLFTALGVFLFFWVLNRRVPYASLARVLGSQAAGAKEAARE